MRPLLLLGCMLIVSGCVQHSPTPSAEYLPRTGEPPTGPEVPELCLPTCAAGLEKLQQNLLHMLTENE